MPFGSRTTVQPVRAAASVTWPTRTPSTSVSTDAAWQASYEVAHLIVASKIAQDDEVATVGEL